MAAHPCVVSVGNLLFALHGVPEPAYVSCGQLWGCADVEEDGFQSGALHPEYAALMLCKQIPSLSSLVDPAQPSKNAHKVQALGQAVNFHARAGTNQNM